MRKAPYINIKRFKFSSNSSALNRGAFYIFINKICNNILKEIKRQSVRTFSGCLSFESGSHGCKDTRVAYFKLVSEGNDKSIRREKQQNKGRDTRRY